MTIIVSKDRKNAERLESSEFGLESEIQEYIYDNPNTIPLYEIDTDIRLFIAAREFQTRSGPIDALGFDQNGNIYVVETKLYRNPDKRTVVAQAMDYGASLWRHSTNFDNFTQILSHHTNKQFGSSFEQKLMDFFELDDTADIMTAIKDNLNTGSIKFVILMDTLHSQLKDLIVYINQNSQFDIYAVELAYYKHAEFEIVIPKLFGDEVKKEVISTKSASYAYEDIDAQQFESHIKARQDVSTEGKNALLEIYDMYIKLTEMVGGSVFYFYSPKARRAGIGINDNDGKQTNLVLSNGEVWTYSNGKTGRIAGFNSRILSRLIDEGLLDKTEKNLTASQWSVRPRYFSRVDSNDDTTRQINRFIEIMREEAEHI